MPVLSPAAHRRLLLACLLTLACALLAACGGGSSGSGASETGGSPAGGRASSAPVERLRWSMPYPVNSLDPAKAFNTSSLLGIAIGLETLMTFDKDGKVQPLLATEVRETGGTTYVYTLRDGVRFWDGSTMTAEDVAYSLNRHRDKRVASQMASFFENVASIEATGPLEVTVRLRERDATWQYVPALAGQVVSKAYAQKAGRKLGGADTMTMGTGPFRFTSFKPEEELQATAFDGYWGERPAVRNVSIRTIEDDAARLVAMRTGEIDGSWYVPASTFDQWKRLPNATTTVTPGSDSYMFFFNTSVKPFDDVHVRRAFAHALDRDAIANKLLRGQAQPADVYIPKRVWANLLDADAIDAFYESLPDYPFDLEAAKAELAKSRYAGGFDVTLKVPSGTDPLSKAALTLAENLKALNVDLKVQEIPASQWTTRVYGHEGLTFETLGEASVYPDPNYYASFLSAKNAKANGQNYASFKHDEATRLFEAQRSETDPAKRAEILKQLTTLAAEELPYLGAYWQETNVTISDELVYDDLGPWFYVTNWAAKIKAAA